MEYYIVWTMYSYVDVRVAVALCCVQKLLPRLLHMQIYYSICQGIFIIYYTALITAISVFRKYVHKTMTYAHKIAHKHMHSQTQ